MFYEINVTFNGRHLFATAERSLRTHDEAQRLYQTMKERFPKHEGFSITCSRYETRGTQIMGD